MGGWGVHSWPLLHLQKDPITLTEKHVTFTIICIRTGERTGLVVLVRFSNCHRLGQMRSSDCCHCVSDGCLHDGAGTETLITGLESQSSLQG